MNQVCIVGPGRIGLNLAAVHLAAGDRVHLVGRSAGDWQRWAQQQGAVTLLEAAAFHQAGALNQLEGTTLIFAVRDDQLHACVGHWAAAARQQSVSFAQAVHVSGFHGLAALQPLAEHAATLIAAHPTRPFGREPESHALRGVPTTLLVHPANATPSSTVDIELVSDTQLGRLAAWQADWIMLRDQSSRAAYHAACSMAANHVTAVFAEAEQVLAQSMSAADARRVAHSLAARAIAACAEDGPAVALTGPAARGDDAVIEAHRKALGPDLEELYDAQLKSVRRLIQRGRSKS